MIFRLRHPNNPQPEPIDLHVGSYTVRLVRKPKQGVRLTITRQGELRLTAPMAYSQAEAIAFIEQHLDWIAKHLERFKAQQALEPADYSQLHYLGTCYPTRIHQHPIGPRMALEADGLLHLYLKPSTKETDLEKIVHAWYAVELRRLVEPLVMDWETKMGVKSAGLRFRRMTSRWGSCHTGTRVITLNTSLAKATPACIEYVVVHELAHLLERGHGPAFKAVLDRYLPDWRERRAALQRGPLPRRNNADTVPAGKS